jgi:UDP-N-acetylglucosamine acyltransferase
MKTLVHPTAIVSAKAHLDVGVEVGPYSIIGPSVVVGKETRIGSHVVIEGRTKIGERNLISSHATLGSRPQDLKYKDEDTEVIIGDENMFREYCNVSLGTVTGSNVTRIGNKCLFMVFTHVAHDCEVGNHVILANSVSLAGHVMVGEHAVLGGLSAVHQFCKVGKFAMIAGGAMVTQDVVPFGMAHGDRAKINGLNVVGLRRLGVTTDELRQLKDMYRLVFESQSTLDEALKRIAQDVPESSFRTDWLDFIAKSERGLCR